METSTSPGSEVRWWDPLAALLLICVLLTAAARLIVTNWTGGLELVRTLAILGAILGLVLGQTRFSPRISQFFGIVYGFFLIPWQMGLTLADDLLWKERILILNSRLGQRLKNCCVPGPLVTISCFLILNGLSLLGLSVPYAGYSPSLATPIPGAQRFRLVLPS
jgi:hypothetical protein